MTSRRILALLLALLTSAAGTPVRAASAPAAAAAVPPPGAGGLPSRLHVTLTGNPADADFVQAAIRSAIERALSSAFPPGTSLGPTQTIPATEPLDRGFLTSFSVPLRIESGGAPAITGTITVDVDNLALANIAPMTLAFSDDPERITADGVLSRTTVDVSRPARVYYYHQNMGAVRRFCVVLSANDSVETRLHIIGAATGPNIDVMSVGHAATKVFLARRTGGEGIVVDIAGGRPLVLRDTPVGPGEVVVGALDLRVLVGGPVTATVMAIPPAAQPRAYLYGPKLPDDGHLRHGVFDLRETAQPIIAYSAGGRDAAYTYGSRQATLSNRVAADAGHDYGDYGVLHHVRFDLDNPGSAPVTVYLYEKPLGGDVRSSFVVNERSVEIGCVRVAQRYLIASDELAPHATGTFDVLTMTDGGSNYPLEIGVSTALPLATAPPISAADGCFPKPGGAPAATQLAPAPTGH